MEKQTTQKPDMFRSFMPTGMLLGMGSLVFETFFIKPTPYAPLFVWAAVALLCVTIPLVINTIKRRTLGQHIGAIATCLFGGLLLGGLSVFITAQILLQASADMPQVEAFAQSGFVDFDLKHDQVVTYTDMDTVIAAQGKVSEKIAQIDTAEAALKASPVQTRAIAQSLIDLESGKSLLAKQLLPAEEMSRMYATRAQLYRFGHVVTNPAPKRAYASDYGATREEMAGARQILTTRYHYWFVAFDKLHIHY
jgi:hypothetical protein